MKMTPFIIICFCLVYNGNALPLQPQEFEEGNPDQGEGRPLLSWAKRLLSKSREGSQQSFHSEKEAIAKAAALAKEAAVKAEVKFREWYSKSSEPKSASAIVTLAKSGIATTPANYQLIFEGGFPTAGCSVGGGTAARDLGRYNTVDECAAAANAAGVQAFTYEISGRQRNACFEEKVPVSHSLWQGWMANQRSSQEPICPGGGWNKEANTNFYAWPPSPTPPPAVSPIRLPAPRPSPSPVRETPGFGRNGVIAMKTGTSFDTSSSPRKPVRLAATGDPHLVNMQGQRFDIFKPGVHTLVQIPQGAAPSATRLRVDASVKQVGGQCADLYFQEINMTGRWVLESKHRAGLYFSVKSAPQTKAGTWQRFGHVQMKVIWGHTKDGFDYLNFYLKDLGHVRYPIGGILGMDDHTAASTPSKSCKRSVALLEAPDKQVLLLSHAEASL